MTSGQISDLSAEVHRTKAERKFTCIMCPLGCEVTVKSDKEGKIVEILGHKCNKGEKYAKDEFIKPMRILTSTVSAEGARYPRLPVKTSSFIPKAKIFECMNEITKVKAKAPIKNGQVIIKDILGLGVDIISTRDL